MNRRADRDAVPPIKNRGEQHTSPAVPNGGNSKGTAGTADFLPHTDLFPMVGTAWRKNGTFGDSLKTSCSWLWEQQKTAKNRHRIASLADSRCYGQTRLGALILNQTVAPSHMGRFGPPALTCNASVTPFLGDGWRDFSLFHSFFSHLTHGRTNHA